jgi:hypothetical protein
MRRALALFLLAFSLPALADITISTITPAAALVGGGTIIHLHGTNLFGVSLACAALECSVYVRFGDTLGTVIFNSADEIVVVAPPHAAGAVDLVVNVPLSPPLTLKNAFNYQDPGAATVRLLLPIATGTPGTFNTQWQADVLAHNATAEPVDIASTTVPAMSTKRLSLPTSSSAQFLDIPRRLFDRITITTHVHDATHDAESLGVDVPSVPETQFRRAVVLPGIPNDARYRVLLRVYGYPGTYPLTIRTVDDQTQKQLVETVDVTLSGSGVAYLQLPLAAPAASPVVRLELSAPVPIWGFITLTNNVTQNVTTITPGIAVAPEAPPTELTTGHWAHAGNCMTVNGTNVGVSYNGCAFGSFVLDSLGPDDRFDVVGSLAMGGACCREQTAHFVGVLTGDTLALTIQAPSQTIGPFTLIYGSTDPCTPPCP